MNDGINSNKRGSYNTTVTAISIVTVIAVILRGIELLISDKFVNITIFFCCLCLLIVSVSLVRKLLFPMIAVIVSLIISLFTSVTGYLLIDLALFVIMFVYAITDSGDDSETKTKKKPAETINVSSPYGSENLSRYYVLIGSHILLSVLTLGIWNLIWIYRTTSFISVSKANNSPSPVITLLLCIFVPFYYIYWTYKTAQTVDLLAREKGINGNTAVACLILTILLPFLPPIIIQDKINQTIYTAVPRDRHFVSIALHVILLLFTFGIWQYAWIYKTTRFTNYAKNEIYRNPMTSLLLCAFIPFYTLYWTYESARRADLILQERGIMSSTAGLCLILAIFIPLIPPLIIQSKVNQSITESFKKLSVYEETESLEKYKKLLENGVITAEEYELKKKQILGL